MSGQAYEIKLKKIGDSYVDGGQYYKVCWITVVNKSYNNNIFFTYDVICTMERAALDIIFYVTHIVYTSSQV